jgi:hypothetical protein
MTQNVYLLWRPWGQHKAYAYYGYYEGIRLFVYDAAEYI